MIGWINNLKIGTRLLGGFLGIAGLLVVVGVLTTVGVSELDHEVTLLDQSAEVVRASMGMELAAESEGTLLGEMIEEDDPVGVEKIWQTISEKAESFQKNGRGITDGMETGGRRVEATHNAEVATAVRKTLELHDSGTLPAINQVRTLLEKKQTLIEARGRDENSGHRGTVRNAAHELEAKLKKAQDPNLMVAYLTLRRHEKDFLARTQAKYAEQFEQEAAAMESALHSAAGLGSTRDGLLAELQAFRQGFGQLAAVNLELADVASSAAAAQSEVAQNRAELRSSLQQVKELAETEIQEQLAAAHGAAKQAKSVAWTSAVAAVAISVLLGLFLSRSISRPLAECAVVAEAIKEGDLTRKLTIVRRDELGALAASLNGMTSNLRGVVERITQHASTIAASSEELSANAGQVNQGSRDQALQTAQSATAMNQMTQTVLGVARNSANAAEKSRESSRVASDGTTTVRQTVEGMSKVAGMLSVSAASIQELGRSSEEIGSIVEVIDDISEQTNLLALNAAIEAARAGEQGRGFAVVADEVRKLAERTRQATAQIAEMIQKIQADTAKSVDSMESSRVEAEAGVETAREAQKAMEAIFASSNLTNVEIEQIAAAAEEQSAAVEQVSSSVQSVSDIAKVTELSVGEINNASSDLARLASELKEITDWFVTAA